MDLAAYLSEMARLAYLDPQQFDEEFVELPGYVNREFICADNAEGYIIEFEDTVILSFRGTQPSQLKDITADLKFWRIDPSSNGEKIHSGFWKEAFSLFPLVVAKTQELRHKPFLITGHSLGGAIAVVMTGFLLDIGYNIQHLYTYGQPRVGNKKFCSKIDRECNWQRFVNNNDIVPRVPLKAGWLFSDGGNLNYINCYGQVRNLTWWQSIKDSFRGRWFAWKKKQWFDSFYDHAIWLYRDLLEDASKK
jgi:triacylglycerol lipase|tara:strand:+ start:1311 stop:2057 length:747 start_codon:yes stop_codon:yes gene_type:complete